MLCNNTIIIILWFTYLSLCTKTLFFFFYKCHHPNFHKPKVLWWLVELWKVIVYLELTVFHNQEVDFLAYLKKFWAIGSNLFCNFSVCFSSEQCSTLYVASWGFLGGSDGKENVYAKQETQVQYLGQEDLLEKRMAPTSVLLPGKSHGQRSLAGYSPQGCKESDMTKWLTLSLSGIL